MALTYHGNKKIKNNLVKYFTLLCNEEVQQIHKEWSVDLKKTQKDKKN